MLTLDFHVLIDRGKKQAIIYNSFVNKFGVASLVH